MTERLSGNWHFGFSLGLENLTSPYEEAGTFAARDADLNSININWIAGEVTVRQSESDEYQFIVTEYSRRELREDEKMHVRMTADTLEISFHERNSSRRIPQKKIEVLVSPKLFEDMIKLSINSTSGAINVDGAGAQTFKAGATSGSINLKNITSQMLDVSATSGSISIDSAIADTIKIDSRSGTVRISDCSSGYLTGSTTSGNLVVSGDFADAKLSSLSGRITFENASPLSALLAKTTSGTQDLTGSFESADADSLSGTVTIRSATVPDFLKAKTTSGKINVYIPDDSAITVSHSATSGRFSSDIPVILLGHSAQFEFSSRSGNTKIYVLK